MKVQLSRRARNDLIAIGDWIRADNPARAESFVAEIEAACLSLAEFPLSHPLYSEATGELRKRVVGNYLILYRVRADQIGIVTIRHGRRDTLV